MAGSQLILRDRLDVGRIAWDAFVDTSDEAWLWHRYDFQDAMSTWPGRHDLGFAIADAAAGGQLVAAVPLHLIEGRVARVFSWNTLDSMGGPACKNDLGEKHKRKILQYALEQLADFAGRHHAVEINLALPTMAPAFRGPNCPRVNPLLDLGCDNTLTQTWVVDLQEPEETLRRAYAELTRRELRKVQSTEHEIREATGPDDVDAYYELHCETYHRTGVPPHPRAYFQAIFEKFVPSGLSRIVFLTASGRLKAAQNTGLYKKGCVYWTGASRSDKDGGENRLMFDNQILSAARRGFQWYDVGEAFPNVEHGKLRGLNNFKRSFGGTLYPYYRGRIVVRKCQESLKAMHRVWRPYP